MKKRGSLTSDEITIKWTDFNPQQWKFVTSKVPFICGSGGMGSGKTVALVRRAILLSINSPWFGDMSGNEGVIGRHAMKDFMMTTYRELKRWLPNAWVKNENRTLGYIELFNGSIIHITHYDELDHILSMNLGWAAIDQMEQVGEEVFEELVLHRVRRMTLKRFDLQGRPVTPDFDENGKCVSATSEERAAALNYHTVFGVCNPHQANKWILKKFIKNEQMRDNPNPDINRMHDPEFKVIYIPTTENKKWLPPEFIERQRRLLSDKQFKRDVEGQWQKYEGLVYEDFTQEHVNSLNYVPPPDWRIVVSIDHGGSGTPQKHNATNIKAVIFMAYTKKGGEWPKAMVYDSLYMGGVTIQACVIAIEERLRMHQRARLKNFQWFKSTDSRIQVDMWRCDPAMQKGMEDADESVLEAYMRHATAIGMDMPLVSGNNDVESGIQRINWMFRENLLTINPWNTEGIEELETVEYGDNGKIKPLQADHFTDALRLAVMSIDFNLDSMYESPPKVITLADMVQNSMDNMEFDNDTVYGNRYKYSQEEVI